MHQPKPRNGNTRESPRFPFTISVAITTRQAEGLELLAEADGLLTVSDHVRQAIQAYLVDSGVIAHLAKLTDRAMSNGNGKDEEAHHG